MKILKFSGIVVGIHLLALVLIFANPGCSASTKPAPAASDTVGKSDSPPTITASGGPSAPTDVAAASGAAPIAFNPDSGVRYSPTRPGTPAASTLQVEPVGNVTPVTTYTVVKGDSLSAIAKKNHTPLAELAAVNNLSANTATIRPGQKLIIPGKVVAPVKANDLATKSAAPANPAEVPSSKAGSEGISITVKAGETLSAIAKKYGVKSSDIAVANNISDPQKIRPGMVLVIPGWKTPEGKTARSSKTPASDSTARPHDSSAPAPAAAEPVPDTTAHTPTSEVPVIQVEEAPAPAK